jgi:hypothetical protein
MTVTDKIRLYGRLMKLLALVIAVIVVGAFGYAASIAGLDRASFDRMMSSYLVSGQMQLTFGPSALAALGIIGLGNLAIMAAGLHSVWRLGDACARGEIFAIESGLSLRRLGGILLAGATSTVLSRTLSVALATTVPDGGQVLVIGLGTSEAFLLLSALMMIVFGHVMVLATEIDAENRTFV